MSKVEKERWWSLSPEEVVKQLDVSPEAGVSHQQVAGRRKEYGLNKLEEFEGRSALRIFIDQFKSLVIIILAVAAVLSFLFGQWVEGAAVSVAVILNAVIGFFTEWRAVRSMDALRKLSQVEARVVRDGEQKNLPADQLVVGDIVIMEGGDMISADMRLLEANKFQTDESTLTGESEPVTKTIHPVDENAPLAERSCMVYKGTFVTRGSGKGVVTETGGDTELGRISELVAEAEPEETPLEKRLDRLGRSLIWVTLVLAGAVAVTGLIRGKELLLMVESAVALAVAAIPEGLPVVATVALARGMIRMSRRNVLINRLSSVETLGTTQIIFTDKTGTLTENRMKVEKLVLDHERITLQQGDGGGRLRYMCEGEEFSPGEDESLDKLLRVSLLCNNASLPREGNDDKEVEGLGDPVEVALLEMVDRSGIDYHRVQEEYPEEREESFDPETKMMAAFNREGEEWMVSVKGAPEEVLSCCESQYRDGEPEKLTRQKRHSWLESNSELAASGYRLLAVAYKYTGNLEEEPYQGLILLGLVVFRDPPRKNMEETMEACRGAGIRVVMVTGDQEETARHVARSIRMTGDREVKVLYGPDLGDPDKAPPEKWREWRKADIFARVTSEQKLDLIDIHQKEGTIVAMTGDGVNDAPALTEADIGIAMGRRGTQVAREASDMILKDDAFATILTAIEMGRAIFKNIRRFILYLLSGNVSEIMIVGVAMFFNMSLPILPLQILFLNLVLDVFPALALGVSEGEEGLMKRPPRPSEEPIIGRSHWLWITGYAVIIGATVLISFILAERVWGFSGSRQVTVSFLTLSFARLWHVFNMRGGSSHPLKNPVVMNPYVWGAILLCTVLILGVVYLPGLAGVLGNTPPPFRIWGFILAMSVVPFAAGQILKYAGADRL